MKNPPPPAGEDPHSGTEIPTTFFAHGAASESGAPFQERFTQSLCPVCLRTLPARLEQEGDAVLLRRICPEHGEYAETVWQGEPSLQAWQRRIPTPVEVRRETKHRYGCPRDCGRCPEHGQRACTVLFEITMRCNLRCPVCFAAAGFENPGAPAQEPFASLEELTEQLVWIREHAGPVVLQLSGGEPTLYPQLAELVRAGRALFPAVQLNTNGILLAERPELARELAEAGLSWVFLQCDGTNDAIHTALRGKPLLDKKLAAVDNCRAAGLSVVLVPTVARGVNDRDLGNLLRLALSRAPTVRGLHLQPMTASGRNTLPDSGPPLTLPETLRLLAEQSDGQILMEHATPPSCEHPRCSFHCRYTLSPAGRLAPLREAQFCRVALDDTVPAACCSAPEAKHVPQSPSPRTEVSAVPSVSRCRPAADTQDAAPPSGAADAPLRDKSAYSVDRAIDVILRCWQGPGKTAAPSEPVLGISVSDAAEAGHSVADSSASSSPRASLDAFDAFLAKARASTFSVTCMAFQDARTADLERLRQCCVHVFAPPDRLVPFCSYNLTALDGTPLHRDETRASAGGQKETPDKEEREKTGGPA